MSMAFLTISIILSIMPVANGAGAITLTPNAQAQSSSVTVTGTGFAAGQPVAIVIGTEITVTGEAKSATGTGTGPYAITVAHYPIKPGSLSVHSVVTSDTRSIESDYADAGDGTCTSSSTYSPLADVNYVAGTFSRSSSSDLTGYTIVFTASYTYYQYTVTPAAGVVATPSGGISAAITVPAATANGNHAVNAFDTKGNRGTANLTVDNTIPEGLSIGIIAVLSTTAVLISTHFFRKQPKTTLTPNKTI